MFGNNKKRSMSDLQQAFVSEAESISVEQQQVIEREQRAIDEALERKAKAEEEKSMADNFVENVKKLFKPQQ